MPMRLLNKGGIMLGLGKVDMVRIAQNPKVAKSSPQKVSFTGSELPHSTKLTEGKADSFQKQHKLGSICVLTDLYGTPAMC